MGFAFNPFTGSFDVINPTWIRIAGSIGGTSSTVVDTIPLAEFGSLDYKVGIHNAAKTEGRHFNINILNLSSTLKDNIYGRVSGSLNVTVAASINGANMELTITNNELFDVDYSIGKLVLT